MAIIDLVKWDTNNPRLLVWKFPSQELSTWTQLVVNDSQEAWLVHEGHYEGPFEVGRHVLSTENIPVISNVLNLPFGGSSPFTAEVWFVAKTEVLDLKWGTMVPMQLMDPVYGVLLPVRAFAQYGLHVVDGRRLLAKLVGTASMYTADQLNNNFRGAITSRIKSFISELIIKEKIPIFELSAHLDDISQGLPAKLDETLALCGERFAVVFMRKMAAFYCKGVKGAAEYKRRLFSADTVEALRAVADEEALGTARRALCDVRPEEVASLPRPQRNDAIRRMRTARLSIRQIERITGVSRGVVAGVR